MKKSAFKKRQFRDMRFYCLMMAIPIIQFLTMWVGVNFNTLVLSFKTYDINKQVSYSFANFTEVFRNLMEDAYLRASLWNSVKFYLLMTCITLPITLVVSFYFYKKFALSRPLKIILFLPSVVAGVVAVTVFYYLADKGWPLLVKTFTGKEVMGLLVNSETRVTTLICYNLFYSLCGNFLFYSSAMSGIDSSISEAAQIDGANLRQEFIHITMPMIWPTFSTFLVSGVAGAMMGDYGMYAFSKISGGSAVPTMGYYFTTGIVEDVSQVRYGYFSALGIVITIASCCLVFPLRALMSKFDPTEDNVEREQQKRIKREKIKQKRRKRRQQ